MLIFCYTVAMSELYSAPQPTFSEKLINASANLRAGYVPTSLPEIDSLADIANGIEAFDTPVGISYKDMHGAPVTPDVAERIISASERLYWKLDDSEKSLAEKAIEANTPQDLSAENSALYTVFRQRTTGPSDQIFEGFKNHERARLNLHELIDADEKGIDLQRNKLVERVASFVTRTETDADGNLDAFFGDHMLTEDELKAIDFRAPEITLGATLRAEQAQALIDNRNVEDMIIGFNRESYMLNGRPTNKYTAADVAKWEARGRDFDLLTRGQQLGTERLPDGTSLPPRSRLPAPLRDRKLGVPASPPRPTGISGLPENIATGLKSDSRYMLGVVADATLIAPAARTIAFPWLAARQARAEKKGAQAAVDRVEANVRRRKQEPAEVLAKSRDEFAAIANLEKKTYESYANLQRKIAENQLAVASLAFIMKGQNPVSLKEFDPRFASIDPRQLLPQDIVDHWKDY